MKPATDLPLALRNAAILGWWSSCDLTLQRAICFDYARKLGCPVAEIDPQMLWPNDLNWLWGRYSLVIDLWVGDQM